MTLSLRDWKNSEGYGECICLHLEIFLSHGSKIVNNFISTVDLKKSLILNLFCGIKTWSYVTCSQITAVGSFQCCPQHDY